MQKRKFNSLGETESTVRDTRKIRRKSSEPQESENIKNHSHLQTQNERTIPEKPNILKEIPVEPKLTDILEVEHAVSGLQSSIMTILEKAPTEEQFKQLQIGAQRDNLPQLLIALQRYKVKLAAKLKTLYSKKGIKLFDQILKFEQLKDISLDFNHSDTSLNVKGSSFQPPDIKQVSEYPPLLPEIKNPAIRAQVFLHKSLVKSKLFIDDKEALHSHNERLEFLGDSILGSVITRILWDRFPDANEGTLTEMRSRLVRNSLLEDWSYMYGFDKRLRSENDSIAEKGKRKLYADVFEAYIGGLMLDNENNYPVIHAWLEQLAEPVLIKFIQPSTKDTPLEKNAKQILYSLIGYASLGLHYDTIVKDSNPVSPRFVVQVKVKDKSVLGSGEGRTIKEAGMRAAMDALNDKEMIEKYSRLRASIPREESRVRAEKKEDSFDRYNQDEKNSTKILSESSTELHVSSTGRQEIQPAQKIKEHQLKNNERERHNRGQQSPQTSYKKYKNVDRF